MKKYQIANKELLAFLPNTLVKTVWYVLMDNEAEAYHLAQYLPNHHALIAIFEPNWEDSLTPWHATRIFKKGRDFGGGATQFATFLYQEVIPKIELACEIKPEKRGFLGYSLAGLFTVYSAICMPFFDYIACVSGSLWFDKWLDFAKTQQPLSLPRAIYFSLGDKEAQTNNKYIATVQTATEETVQIWQSYHLPVAWKLNLGGHFDKIPQRLAQAMLWLAQY